jgi:adenine deaminase
VQGFGLRGGALATTFNSQQENMIIVGGNDEDMALAANTLAEHGGGFVAVSDGEVLGILELPLFGLDTDQEFDQVVVTLRRLHELVSELGCKWPAPFHSLGFIGLPVAIGDLKIAPEGLIDVWAEKVVPILADQTA